ncbi:MAG: hypothetical protein NTZ78_14710 [Candidatus Aureabacteria bacterium]|nr:hypothetical protein [Candidatus Auribacterota bacterium]
MRRLTVVIISVMFAVGMAGIAIAGSLDSPGLPSAGSGMYTLMDIYNYLNSGTVAPTPCPFRPPDSGPGSTMKNLKEIYEAIATPFPQCDATAANVESGKKFFSMQSGSWGVQTGTLVVPPTPTPTPTSTITPTITPTWGQTRCEEKGGTWWPLGGGLSGSGCWFLSDTKAISCTTYCPTKGAGFACLQQNWDDDSSCSLGKVMKPGTYTCRAIGNEGNYPMAPGFFVQAGEWWTRQNSALAQDCNSSHYEQYRFCVCQP